MTPESFYSCINQPMVMYAVMFMCNIAAGKLVATGAFEIYSGSGDLLFSKINSGMRSATETLEHASSANVKIHPY